MNNIINELIEVMEKIQVVSEILLVMITDETHRKDNQVLISIILNYISKGQTKILFLQEKLEKSF